MASFTDIQPQFTPYVHQLPIEAMVKVGMEKQQRYDEGVQKIQQSIDNVGALDIMNPAQQQYLQSKLNQLGSNLKTVAAGDFSNFQLVNSVGGMVTQIVKDPTIQTAVNSTAKARQGLQDMQAAKKAGKSSPSNEWIFGQAISNYANNKDINASFNGSFEEAIDTDKDLLEQLKAAHADKLAEDENVLSYDANGKAVINHDLIQHKMTEGLSSSKVMSIARSVYSKPANARQLQIDALYNYKDYDANGMIADKMNALNYKKELIFAQTPYLRTYASLSSGDKQIQANKDLLNNYNQLVSLDSDFNSFKELATKNLDGAKYSAHLDNKLQQAVKDFSWSTVDSKTEVNPQFTVNMERSKFTEQQKMNEWNIKNIQSQIQSRADAALLAQMKLEGKVDANGMPIWQPGTPPVDSEAVSKLGSGSFYKQIAQTTNDQNQLFANITAGIGVDLNGKHYDDLYVKGDDNQWTINPKYKNTDPNSKYLLNELGGRLYNSAKAQLRAKINAVGELHLNGDADKAYADDIKKWWDMGSVINAQKAKAKETEEQFAPIINQLQKEAGLKDSYNVSILTPNGSGFFTGVTPKNIKLTKDQLTDIALYNQGKNIFGADDDSSSQAYTRLKGVFGNDVDNIIKNVVTPNGAAAVDAFNAYRSVATQLKNSKTKEALVNRENAFKSLQRQSVGQELTLNTADPKIKENIRVGLVSELETIMKDKSSGSYEKAASMLEKIKGSDSLSNNLIKFRYDDKSGKWYAHVSNLSGGSFNEEAPEIEISKGFANNLKLNKMVDPKEQYFNDSTFGQILNLNKGYSTVSGTTPDLDSPKAYATALERGNIGNYTVGFHVVAKDPSNTQYLPYMYAKDKKTGKIYPKILMDWSKLAQMPGLSDYERQILLNQGTVYDKTQIVPAIEEFKRKLADPAFADKAMKLLIGNYDNQ